MLRNEALGLSNHEAGSSSFIYPEDDFSLDAKNNKKDNNILESDCRPKTTTAASLKLFEKNPNIF